jgi:hypothetical protein
LYHETILPQGQAWYFFAKKPYPDGIAVRIVVSRGYFREKSNISFSAIASMGGSVGRVFKGKYRVWLIVK